MTSDEITAALKHAEKYFGTSHLDTEAIVSIMKELPLDFFCVTGDAMIFRITRPLTAAAAWRLGTLHADAIAKWDPYDKQKHNGTRKFNGFEPLELVHLPTSLGTIFLEYTQEECSGDMILPKIEDGQTTFYLWFNE